MSSADEASPVELKARICDQSRPSMQPLDRQARTSVGTTPSTFTRACSTNAPNSPPVGTSSKSAIVARLISAAKINHGPIIQPRFVGQATTCPGRTSW